MGDASDASETKAGEARAPLHPPHAGALRAARWTRSAALAALTAALLSPWLLRTISPEGAVAAAYFPRQLVLLDLPAVRLARCPSPFVGDRRPPERLAPDPWGTPFLLGPRRGGAPWPAGLVDEPAGSPPWAVRVYSCGPDRRDDQGLGDDVAVPAALARPHVAELFMQPLDASRFFGPRWGPLWLVVVLSVARPALLALAALLGWLAASLWLAARPRGPRGDRRARLREVAIVLAVASGPAAAGSGALIGGTSLLGALSGTVAPSLVIDPLTAAVASWIGACLLVVAAWRRSLPAPGDEPRPPRSRRRLLAALGLVALLAAAAGGRAATREPWLLGRPLSSWEATLASNESEPLMAAGLALAQAGPDAAPLVSSLVAAHRRVLGSGRLDLSCILSAALARTGPDGAAHVGSLAITRSADCLGPLRGLAHAGPAGAPFVDGLARALTRHGAVTDDYVPRALAALGPLGAAAAPALRRALDDPRIDPKNRLEVARALAAVAPEQGAPALAAILATEFHDHRALALIDLARLGPRAAAAAPALIEHGLLGERGCEAEAVLALLAVQGEAFDRAALARALAAGSPATRGAGLLAASLLQEPGSAAIEAGRAALGDPEPDLRRLAALVLAVHGAAGDRAALDAALDQERDADVRRVIELARTRRPAR